MGTTCQDRAETCLNLEGASSVVNALNLARVRELYAISQYMDQHFSLADRGYGELAKNVKLIAIDEMRHAEMLGERVKELGGNPTYDQENPVEKNQSANALFPFNSCLEKETIGIYNSYKKVCVENADSVSEKIFAKLIAEEEAHHRYFSDTAAHLENFGDIFLAKMAGTPSSTGAPSKGFVDAK